MYIISTLFAEKTYYVSYYDKQPAAGQQISGRLNNLSDTG